jgi:hypothetical protein
LFLRKLLGVEQITKTDRLNRVTPFADKANPVPRYGGLVPPFHPFPIQKNEDEKNCPRRFDTVPFTFFMQ